MEQGESKMNPTSASQARKEASYEIKASVSNTFVKEVIIVGWLLFLFTISIAAFRITRTPKFSLDKGFSYLVCPSPAQVSLYFCYRW